MAEDLDDLLDEVESKFCKKSGKKPSATEHARQGRVKGSVVIRKDESDLNSMIEDICADDGPAYKPLSSNQKVATTKPQSLCTARKCFPVYLGGSRFAAGLSSASVKRTCDKLYCTSCDFQVVSFDNWQWHSRCDYLFFRNNIPDFSKLKVNLLKKSGSRAYACQCSWRSISQLTDLETETDLRWVCGKHS